MPVPEEGYVLHSYGPPRYAQHAVASVETLRRHDAHRPVALYCPPAHRALLERHGLAGRFAVLADLPAAHRSIVGFKHHLHRFKPFARSLFVDADMVWCRDPEPLWARLRGRGFTATGLERADPFFGGPKGAGVLVDVLLRRRQRTLRRFGLSHLPRVQAGMIYADDDALTEAVCTTARGFLRRIDETHFRSRLEEGRTEESCEWSLAMAMSRHEVPILPWFDGAESPQLDYIDSLTRHDDAFRTVRCRYHPSRLVYEMRGLPAPRLRGALMHSLAALASSTWETVTPYALHFGWLHQKTPFYDLAARTWARLTTGDAPAALPHGPAGGDAAPAAYDAATETPTPTPSAPDTRSLTTPA